MKYQKDFGMSKRTNNKTAITLDVSTDIERIVKQMENNLYHQIEKLADQARHDVLEVTSWKLRQYSRKLNNGDITWKERMEFAQLILEQAKEPTLSDGLQNRLHGKSTLVNDTQRVVATILMLPVPEKENTIKIQKPNLGSQHLVKYDESGDTPRDESTSQRDSKAANVDSRKLTANGETADVHNTCGRCGQRLDAARTDSSRS